MALVVVERVQLIFDPLRSGNFAAFLFLLVMDPSVAVVVLNAVLLSMRRKGL